jgi:hypothetical protein
LAACLVQVCGMRAENVAALVDPPGPEPFLDAVTEATASAADQPLVAGGSG